MTAYETHDAWAEENRPRAKSIGATARTASGVETKSKSGSNPPKVLARLPDLDVAELDRIVETGSPRSDGRLLGQRLSTAILFGGGVLLLLVAVIPFSSGKKPRATGTSGDSASWRPAPPAPSASVAPAWNATAAGTSTSREAPAEAAPRPSVPPIPLSIPPVPAFNSPGQEPATGKLPENPPWGSQSLWNPPGNQAQTSSLTSRGPLRQTEAPGQASFAPEPSTPQSGSRRWDLAAPPPVATQPDSSTGLYPTTPYAAGYETIRPNPGYYYPSGQPQAYVNQPMAVGDRVDSRQTPATDLQADLRSNPQSGFPPVDYVGAGGMVPVPTVGTGVLPEQPGVARLEGVIEKSTYRPTYDRDRPSLH